MSSQKRSPFLRHGLAIAGDPYLGAVGVQNDISDTMDEKHADEHAERVKTHTLISNSDMVGK